MKISDERPRQDPRDFMNLIIAWLKRYSARVVSESPNTVFAHLKSKSAYAVRADAILHQERLSMSLEEPRDVFVGLARSKIHRSEMSR